MEMFRFESQNHRRDAEVAEVKGYRRTPRPLRLCGEYLNEAYFATRAIIPPLSERS